MCKIFQINQEFTIPGHIHSGRIVYLKTWGRGWLRDCQLLHVMMNNSHTDTWRVFKWADGTINRAVKLDR